MNKTASNPAEFLNGHDLPPGDPDIENEIIRVPEQDALKAENLQLRMRVLQQEFDLAQIRIQSEMARLNQELNGFMRALCERLNVSPGEYELDLVQRAFVKPPASKQSRI